MSEYVISEETKESVNLFRVLRERAENTPDFKELREEGHLHPVFVYGTLKQGFGNHRLLYNKAIYAGRAYTCTPLFIMKRHGFPIVFKQEDMKTKHGEFIMGELYYVGLNVLCDLDHLEGNGYMYQRERKAVFCCDQRYNNKEGRVLYPHVKAWTYIGMPKFWQDREKLESCPIEDVKISDHKTVKAFVFN